jgi:hypothetical protein
MGRALCILLLAAGAALPAAGCAGASSVVDEVPEELRRTRGVVPAAGDRHPFADPSGVEVGRWATYREGARTFTLAVAGREAEGTWVEVVDEASASVRLVAPDGTVLKAFYQEPGGPAQPQPLDQRAAPAAPRRTETARETGEEAVKVGARELAARRVRIRSEDLEGRLTEETWLWHPDVPALHSGGELGGLVRRVTPAGRIDLLDFGAGRAPAVKRP